MHKSIALLPLLALGLIALPAGTQTAASPKPPSVVTLYSNGPINGDQDAFTINYTYAVTNSFFVQTTQPHAYVTAISFGAWLYPGLCVTCSFGADYVSSVQVQIGTFPFDNSIFDGVVTSWVANPCVSNAYGYELCQETAQFRGPALTPGAGGTTYWLTLQNAIVSNSGVANTDPAFWDENSGVGCPSPGCPSLAQENNGIGTIPSESFTVEGYYAASDQAAGVAHGKNPSGTPQPGPSVLSSSGR